MSRRRGVPDRTWREAGLDRETRTDGGGADRVARDGAGFLAACGADRLARGGAGFLAA